MGDPDIRVYEFLYRGWPPDSGKEPGHHVQFWRRMVDGKGKDKWVLDPDLKSVSQAAEDGCDIAVILGGITFQALLQVDALKVERDELRLRFADLEDRLHRAEAALSIALMDSEIGMR